jgi:hypothetical protein
MEMSGQFLVSATLPPGKQPLGTHWIERWVGLRHYAEEKNLTPAGILTPAVQSVARYYTDCAIQAPYYEEK